jgi:hypoxanthine phosphoribosyltransferase
MIKHPPAASSITQLIPTDEINERIRYMADDISRVFPDDLMIVPLLRGSFVFAADLIRALHSVAAYSVLPQIDFMTLSSYGGSTTSSGSVDIVRDIAESVEGRDVLIIDDILESGRTLNFARELISNRGARSIRIAVLLEKPGKRKINIEADFVGFVIPDEFVIGYGLDYDNYYRELPFIGTLPSIPE